MSATRGDSHNAWIERVLRVSLADPGTQQARDADAPPGRSAQSPAMAFRDRWRAVRVAWTEATYDADQQISALIQYLRGSGDEDLVVIADFGFTELMDRKRRLNDAMLALEGANPEAAAKSAPAVLNLANGLRAFVDSDLRVAASDQNPWGVAVSLRRTLSPVLSAMENALATAP